jgi:hypothetical protein
VTAPGRRPAAPGLSQQRPQALAVVAATTRRPGPAVRGWPPRRPPARRGGPRSLSSLLRSIHLSSHVRDFRSPSLARSGGFAGPPPGSAGNHGAPFSAPCVSLVFVLIKAGPQQLSSLPPFFLSRASDERTMSGRLGLSRPAGSSPFHPWPLACMVHEDRHGERRKHYYVRDPLWPCCRAYCVDVRTTRGWIRVRILDRNEEKEEGEKGSRREQHELGGTVTATCRVV